VTQKASDGSYVGDIESNHSEIYQANSIGVVKNSATVKQDNLSFGKTISYVEQTGSANTATVEQVSGSSYYGGNAIQANSIVEQSGNDNTAAVNQGSLAGGINSRQDYATNDSTIRQGGNNNQASVTQSGYEPTTNWSDINQSGDNNHAKVNQSGVSSWGVGIRNTSTIDQSGSFGHVEVTQTFSSGTSTAINWSDVQQSGGTNDQAYVFQSAYHASNTSGIIQTGSGNFTSVNQH
jgi:hypothetical protein